MVCFGALLPASFLSPWVGVDTGAVLLLGVGAAVAVAFAKLGATRRRLHSPRFAAKTERSFTEYLTRFGMDQTVVAATYRHLREIQDVRFPILPSDTLDWDLGLDEDKVGQVLRELGARLDRQPLRTAQLPMTVEDLVRAVELAPRRGEAAAA